MNWQALSAIDGTVACYAGGRLVPALLQRLFENGAEADSPAALIYRGTLPGQRTLVGAIGTLFEPPPARPPPKPALLIVGQVVGLREHLRWFDERPLFGKRIVVTRSPEQASELVDALETLGAQAIPAPTFHVRRRPRIRKPSTAPRLRWMSTDWVVFEAASTVTRFLAALTRGPRDLRALGRVHLCAIGRSTGDRLTAARIGRTWSCPRPRQIGSPKRWRAWRQSMDDGCVRAARSRARRAGIRPRATRGVGDGSDRLPHGAGLAGLPPARRISIAACSTGTSTR